MNKLRRFWLISITALLGFSTAVAFHAPPWDTGHNSFQPDLGDMKDPRGNGCNLRGSPFDISTGNFVYPTRDFFIPAVGYGVDLTRTYNSQDRRRGPFGRGWSSTYDIRLVIATDEVLLYGICRQGNGKRDRFVKRPDGTFTPPAGLFADLASDGKGGFVYTEVDGNQRRFDADGRLTSLVDRNLNTLSFGYDSTGFMISIKDSAGREIHFIKGANGRIAEIDDFALRSFKYTYDLAGNLSSFTDQQGNTTSYQYDSSGNLIKIVQPNQNVVQQLTYDSQSKVTGYLENGGAWTVSYFPTESKVTKRSPSAQTWTYFYNSNGNIVKTIDPTGATEELTYDSQFNVTGTKNKNGKLVLYNYGENNSPTGITDPLGNKTLVTYNTSTNLLTSATDPLGHRRQFIYDAKGNMVQSVDANNNTTSFTYDAKGEVARITDSLGNTMNIVYDTFGNRTEITNLAGRTQRVAYDALGNAISVTDGLGRNTRFDYDALGRLTKVIDALGNPTSYTYDPNSNLTSMMDASGRQTKYQYDSYNRVTKTTDPLNNIRSFSYDSSGRLASYTDAKGVRTDYAYNNLDRLIQKQSPTNTVLYRYDAAGNLISVSDSDSALDLTYDAASHVKQVTAALRGTALGTISYSFDAVGNRINMVDPSNGQTQYTYDSLNRIVAIKNPKGELNTWSYDSLSRVTKISLGNGSTVEYEYGKEIRPTTLTNKLGGQTISSYTSTYNGVGQRATVSDNSGQANYNYDALNRLAGKTVASDASLSESYTYDAVGNRTASHLSGRYLYDAGDRLLEDDKFVYSYDLNGNLIQKRNKTTAEVTQFNYDSDDQLVRVVLPQGTVVTYAYDGLGRRIEKNANGTVTRFLHDRQGVLFTLNASNQVTGRYTFGAGIDNLVSADIGGTSYFYHKDFLGSIRQVSDITPKVISDYRYDSFGRIVQRSGTSPDIFTYASREPEPESGLMYYRARYYNPDSGRFIGADPAITKSARPDVPDLLARSLLEPQAIHSYAYVKNNPVNFTDPSGLVTECAVTELSGFGAYFVGAAGGCSAYLCRNCGRWERFVLCSICGCAGYGAGGGVSAGGGGAGAPSDFQAWSGLMTGAAGPYSGGISGNPHAIQGTVGVPYTGGGLGGAACVCYSWRVLG